MEVKINAEKDWKYIREEVFMKEQGFQNEFDDIDSTAIHVTLYENEDLIGCGRTFPSSLMNTYTLGRIAILKKYRGKGYGSIIVKELEKQAIHHGATAFILDAQQRACAFYVQLGYTQHGEVHMDEHVPHIQMIKYIR